VLRAPSPQIPLTSPSLCDCPPREDFRYGTVDFRPGGPGGPGAGPARGALLPRSLPRSGPGVRRAFVAPCCCPAARPPAAPLPAAPAPATLGPMGYTGPALPVLPASRLLPRYPH